MGPLRQHSPLRYLFQWTTSRAVSGPLLLLLLGIGLRLWRLRWQPLWADEGYSAYFASEPLGRMLQLTAHDIHPPLYYALLHGWLQLLQSTTPLVLRTFSILTVLPALLLFMYLSHSLFPHQPRRRLIALLLFGLNPLLLFYSQEVRMYGLALTLTLASTLCCWQALMGQPQHRRGWWLGYLLSAAASLYTLYYTAFLLIAQLLWAIFALPRTTRSWRPLLVTQVGVGLLFLPWLLYTATTLITYVDNKVQADQDVALSPLAYVGRHLLAFVAGHLTIPEPLAGLRWLGLGALLLLGGVTVWQQWSRRARHATTGAFAPATDLQAAHQALTYWVAIPTLIAFLINLRFPFFPEGGERLLLFVLPYFLLLVAAAIDQSWQRWRIGQIALVALLVAASAGIGSFYTQPRQQAADYRPLLRQIVQQGNDADTVLATFPWQVGLWRAYAAQNGLLSTAGPKLQLLSDGAVAWDATVQQAVDQALAQGTLWLPLLRSIGSTLPAEFEGYLDQRATNLVNGWYGDTTLTAWRVLAQPPATAVAADWGAVQLRRAGVTSTTVAAANGAIRVDLDWQGTQPADYGLSLRLQRGDQLWGGRDLATLAPSLGFIVGAGLPPGSYQLLIGVTTAETGGSPTLLPRRDDNRPLVELTTIQVTVPPTNLSPARLPIQQPLPTPARIDELALLGSSGAAEVALAGTALDLRLFWQKLGTGAQEHQLYISLLDDAGAGVAGWEGWPLPDYPTAQWANGALVQTPVTVVLPATLASGSYQLGAGLIDADSGTKSPIVLLAPQQIRQRQATFTPQTPPQKLPQPAQFGTHARLQGYQIMVEGEQIQLQLYWQLLQTLWPPHHIFVHLDTPQGETLTQADGVPQGEEEPAPTGSWLPGEYLVTTHELTATAWPAPAMLRVGLYLPATGARLPVTIGDQAAGDAVTIHLEEGRN